MIGRKVIIFLALFVLLPAVLSQNNDRIEIGSDISDENFIALPFGANTEDKSFIENIINTYRRHLKPQLSKEFEVSQDGDQKYKMWKRNADIINTLLGFPRRMLLAGR